MHRRISIYAAITPIDYCLRPITPSFIDEPMHVIAGWLRLAGIAHAAGAETAG